MPCLKCKTDAFTIRGLCAMCAPTLHADHATEMDFMREAEEAYRAETGKSSLELWYDFETFLERFLLTRPDALAAFERTVGRLPPD